MGDVNSTESPLEAAAGAAGPHATEAFEQLGNETRLAILLALWEAYDPLAEENAVPFSELRERVGMRDSGQFNYHLGKLDGQFVRKTDDGYRLRPVGLQLVQTVIAGTGQEATLPPTEIDMPCNLCGAPTAITYADGWLHQVCTECEGGLSAGDDHPEGALFGEPFSPAALKGRTPEEIFAAGVFRLLQVMTMKLGGLCPHCSSVMESSMEVCETHDPAPGEVCAACGRPSETAIRWVCTVCKYKGGSSPSSAAVLHPEVVAFYHDRGLDIGHTINDFETSKHVLTRMREHEQELLSTDPLRVRVTVRYDDDELRLTFDGELNVVEVTR